VIINFGLVLVGCSNWGTESDPDFKYHTGNTDPRGYGMCDFFDF
jgi:hypothetical protein